MRKDIDMCHCRMVCGNLPLLVLKARHLSGSALCTGFSRLVVPEQALDGIPLGLGSVVKINLPNFRVCVCVCV